VHRSWYGRDGPADFGAIGQNAYLSLVVQCGWPGLVLLAMAAGTLGRPIERGPWGTEAEQEAGRRLAGTALAGAAVLLTGFCFWPGLETVGAGAWVWSLLALASAFGWLQEGNRSPGLPTGWRVWWMGLIGLAWAGLWVWAKGGDEFERQRVRLRDDAGRRREIWWVEPRGAGPKGPWVIYAPEPGQSWPSWGAHAVQLAGVGLRVVAVPLNAGDEAEAMRSLAAVKAWLLGWGECGGGRAVWVAHGGAAAAVLRFLAREDLADPWVCVESGPTSGLLAMLAMFRDSDKEGDVWSRLGSGEWIWGGWAPGRAESSLEEGQEELRRTGARVGVTHVMPLAHVGLDQDRLLFRVAGEACWRLWGYGEVARHAMSWTAPVDRGPWWMGLLPSLAWAIGMGVWLKREKTRSGPSPGAGRAVEGSGLNRTLRVIRVGALLLALAALVWHGLHWGLLQSPADEGTAGWARKRLVADEERADWDRLMRRMDWRGRPWRVAWEHAHLVAYNRLLLPWGLPKEVEERWVLDPRLSDEDDGELEWRRWLWERLYPRVRKEPTISSAVGVVVGYLRSQVGTGWWGEDSDLRRMWSLGWATARGFELLCVAGLRSVGIPARRTTSEGVVYWENGRWHKVPVVTRGAGR
jgi:hypothetical protein